MFQDIGLRLLQQGTEIWQRSRSPIAMTTQPILGIAMAFVLAGQALPRFPGLAADMLPFTESIAQYTVRHVNPTTSTSFCTKVNQIS